jgi:hypothetical protein
MPDTDRDALTGRLARLLGNQLVDAGATVATNYVLNLQRAASTVLDHLTAAGWGPCASRCRHHDGYCSDIAQANADLGEALTAERAEVERLQVLVVRILDHSAFTHAQIQEYRLEAGIDG